MLLAFSFFSLMSVSLSFSLSFSSPPPLDLGFRMDGVNGRDDIQNGLKLYYSTTLNIFVVIEQWESQDGSNVVVVDWRDFLNRRPSISYRVVETLQGIVVRSGSLPPQRDPHVEWSSGRGVVPGTGVPQTGGVPQPPLGESISKNQRKHVDERKVRTVRRFWVN